MCGLRFLEAVTEVRTINPGVDLDLAQTLAIQFGLGLNRDVTCVEVEEPVIIEHHVKPDLATESPAITQFQVRSSQRAGGLFAEKTGVVDSVGMK